LVVPDRRAPHPIAVQFAFGEGENGRMTVLGEILTFEEWAKCPPDELERPYWAIFPGLGWIWLG
jgi:hypothetical protein